MNRLVVGNLVHRPLRSIISALAVAIEVIMILSIAAIMLGMLNGQKTRNSGIGMDLIARPGTTSNLIGVSGAAAPAKAAKILEKIPHVLVASPVYIQLTASGASVENVYGIDYESFNALKPFVFLEGGPFQNPYDILIDDYTAHSGTGLHVGDTIEVMHQKFRVCGIVEHGKGGRKFMSLDTMNAIEHSEGRASMFYMRTEDVPKYQDDVKRSIKATEGMEQYDVQTLEEMLSQLTPEKFPGFNIALNIVIGIAIIIGFIVIFQSMYTAVMERTREIGILKSLGASRMYIVSVVLRETGLLAVCGIALGIGATYLMRTIFHVKFPTLEFAVTPRWVLDAALIAFTGAILGALYPAWKASRKDPIDALSYE
jgi:putative ABC transport system permease protein